MGTPESSLGGRITPYSDVASSDLAGFVARHVKFCLSLNSVGRMTSKLVEVFKLVAMLILLRRSPTLLESIDTGGSPTNHSILLTGGFEKNTSQDITPVPP
jgi:hypothetical protein